jgi:hypothetical protein
MNTDSTVRFISALFDLIDDFISQFQSRMIATQLIRSVAATAVKYRTVQRNRRIVPGSSRMCLVLEEADRSSAWLERFERQRLSRRLEPVRQALHVADQIIEKTFAQRRPVHSLPRFVICQEIPRNNRGLGRD